MIINRKTRKIIDVGQGKGSVHDCRVYKETIVSAVVPSIEINAGVGYRGTEKLRENSLTPKKASKHHKLTEAEKAYTKRLARKRVVIDHINAKIKTCKVMAYPYRNHCQRHLLRVSLMCGIIKFELHIRNMVIEQV